MNASLKERIEIHQRLGSLGFSYQEANQLRRIATTLRRWYELECGAGNSTCTVSIERNEKTDQPFKRIQFQTAAGGWADQRYPIADREKGALNRLSKLMALRPELTHYVQTDPRGAALYILRRSDVNGHEIEQVYNRGIAVY